MVLYCLYARCALLVRAPESPSSTMQLFDYGCITVGPDPSLLPLIHLSAWKRNSPKFAVFRGFSRKGLPPKVHRGFIAAHYGSGGVGLPSASSSFSFPELLLGFPMAHPSLYWLYFSCECAEVKVSEEVRGWSLSSLCLSAACRCSPTPPPDRREVTG